MPEADDGSSRRLYVYNGGLLARGRVRRILELAGYRVCLGAPGPEDLVGVWGRSPTAGRGEFVAERRGAGILRVEDAFLRSVRPGRAGEPPLGLMLDRSGVHFDPSRPSDLETLLATDPLDDFALLERARALFERIRRAELSKYNNHDLSLEPPAPGSYALVIDQTEADASVTASGATPETFAEMLAYAEIEQSGARILIKTHPETREGFRRGHFGAEAAKGRVEFLTAPIAPYALLEGATAVYTVSSQLGFEAIMAGHRPRVFGQPFYAGWGLTEDEHPVARRERKLTRAQLFAAAMFLAPTWYDPCRDRLCTPEEAIDQLEAEVRCWREDRAGHVATGMRLWKRPHLQRFYGRWRPLRFDDRRPVARARAEGRGVLAWASAAEPLAVEAAAAGVPFARVEDGFLRSQGLGAALVPPLSLAADDLGIYYDPTQESRLERLIAEAAALPEGELLRAERLVAAIVKAGVTKYMVAGDLPAMPEGHLILVPGQVEDDASILTACRDERTNLALLERTRAENPGARIVYKPHPDVAAGLRPGAVPEAELARLADLVVGEADPAALVAAADEVWTLTSLLGFEALLRGKSVTCLGAPFYAGWGLTRDLGAVPARRGTVRPSLEAMAHAALIAYPRYRDPVSGLPCPAEVIVERLASGAVGRPAPALRALAKLQGLFASYAFLWRR